MPEPIPAVAIRRVSSAKQQQQGRSLEVDQPKIIRRIEARHGLRVVKEFSEVKSAKRVDRDIILDALAYMEQHHIPALVMAHVDRLSRDDSRMRVGDILDRLAALDATVYSDTESFEALKSNDVAMLLLGIRMGLSAMENRRRSWGVKQSHATRFACGYYGGVVTPYGYRKVATAQPPGYGFEPDPAEAVILRELFERTLAGEGLVRLIRWATDQGMAPRRSKVLSVNTISLMLRNPIYVGLMHREGDVQRAVNVVPLLPMDLWQAVQDQRRDNRLFHNRQQTSRSIFSGLLFCDACGSRLLAIRKSRHGFVYYRCQRAKLTNGCDQQSVREDRLLALLEPDLLVLLRQAEQYRREVDESAERSDILRRRSVVQAKLDRLLALYQLGAEDPAEGIALEEYRQHARPLREEAAELDEAIESLRRRSARPVLELDLQARFQQGGAAEKRLVVRRLIGRMMVRHDANGEDQITGIMPAEEAP